MQNFTFGRKGTNWFLFAFVLLIGTLPSFGQEDCPAAGDFPATQDFCYLETIDDLDTDGNPVFQTNEEGDTQPIPGGELLEGTTYYIGGEDCAPEYRLPLEVNVTSAARPVNQITDSRTQGFEFTTCASEDFDSDDLASLFVADTDYEIEVYDSESGEIPYNGVLAPGGSYFVGQVSTGNDCPSLRTAVGFNPNEIEGPSAEATQTFCEEATVSDLVAEETYDDTQTIRWYRSQTANSPLSEDTQLINGVTYFAAQIVNERGSITPPCETPVEDRTAVTVEILNFDAGEDTGITLCLSEIEQRLDDGESPEELFLALVEDRDLPSDVSFDPSIDEIADDYNNDPIQTFTTEATFTTEEGCEDTVELSITIEESFEAGDDNTGNTLCRSDIEGDITEDDVETYLEGLLSDDADEGGEFSPSASEIADDVNSSSDEISFDITYTIGEGTGCEDSANLEVTVLENPDAGEDNTGNELCNADIPDLVQMVPEDVEELYFELLEEGVPQDGTFEPSIEDIVEAYNEDNFQEFSTTYTITNENGCEDSVELSYIITDTETADAGSFSPDNPYCSNEDPIGLTELQEDEDATIGGTFSGDGVEGNQFNPSIGAGTYTITYTVNESINCVEGEASTDFEIEVIEGPDAGNDIEDSICLSEVLEIAENYDPQNPEATLTELFKRFDWDGDVNGTFDPNINILAGQLFAYYQDENRDSELLLDGTYTVGDEQEECGTDTAEFSITVYDGEQADAGEDNTEGNIICNATIVDGMFPTTESVREYYLNLLDEGVSRDGTFEPTIQELVDLYNNESEIGVFPTTYTVGEGECTDSAELALEVIEPTDANVEFTQEEVEVCSTSESIVLTDYVVEEIDGATFSGSEFIDGNIFNVEAAGEGDYEITYSIEAEGDCITGETSDEVTIIVTDEIDANAGDFNVEPICSNESLDLYSELSAEATMGGTFTLDGETIENGEFTPSEAGNYNITYTVDESIDCVTGEDSATFEVVVFQAPNAGPDVTESYCISEIEEMIEDPSDITEWFLGFIDDEDIDQDGEFSPSIEEIALDALAYVQNPQEDSKTFETTYTVSNDNCDDSAEISITINTLEEAEAGEIEDEVFCTTDSDVNLNDYLSDDATEGGMFMVDGEELENGIFSPEMMGTGSFELEYVVDETVDCVEGSDSVEFSIEVLEGIDLGDDINIVECAANVDPNPTLAEVEDYFMDLLTNDAPEGSFGEGELEDIRDRYLENQEGIYSATYTAGNENCEDSITITVEVISSEPANAGEDISEQVCSSDADINLYDWVSEDANQNGYFEGYEDGIFSPAMFAGEEVEITYTVDATSACIEGEDSATFTITVEQGADAGEDMSVTVCSNDGQQDLYSLISADADTDGEFTLDGEVIADGIMDPSEFEPGTYEVTYTVTADSDQCGGDDSATITITLGNAPEAPTTGEAIAFCAIDGETATRLAADGTNLTWYSDAELSMMVSEEDLLVDGDYYVTQSSDEGCESEAAVLTVNIVDSPAPTISSDYELCEFDNPTIADLSAEINESGEVTWYESADSMNALSNNATLTDGTTYYATLISDNGCESSERLAVTVTLEDCALLFPEAITPNGDGRNDRFVIENIEREYPNFNITIFNRWGNAVYKGNASTPTWDGTSNQSGSLGDDVLPVGVYFYVVDFNDGSTEPRQGKVYLNR